MAQGRVPIVRGLTTYESFMLTMSGFTEPQLRHLAMLRRFRDRWH